jgi:hypothetical protein
MPLTKPLPRYRSILSAVVGGTVFIIAPELQSKFVSHLIAPLKLKGGRTYYERLPSTVTQNKFQQYHPSFNGLPKTNVIRDQKIDPRHLNRTNDGIKLVVFNVNTASKR